MSLNVILSRVPRFLIALFNPIQRQICRFLLFLQIFAVSESFADIPQKKEFRGVWIATINNVDWPSAPGLPDAVQKRELKELIDHIGKLNLNVVIFQVRPASDTFYQSDIEPWSYFLTGKQGQSPSPSFDPLQFAIDLCHSKGMELHAWFNPFRVRNLGFYKLDPHSFAAQNPQYVHEYDHKFFLDPGFPQVREHINRVIMEVVRKYNIDAIHFDDYFYPYPKTGLKFPDQKTFRQYGNGYYPTRLNDWRRNNINLFIGAIRDSIKAVKPSVKLGVSPFGIWRNKSSDPNGSPGVKGTSSYDDLYADVYHWLANDWIDYVIPQIYWEQGNRFGDFKEMVKWWNDHCFGKPLYIGQALFKSTGEERVFENPKEISEQISILRNFDNVGGFSLYSASQLARLSESALAELSISLFPPKTEAPQPIDLVNNSEPEKPASVSKEVNEILLADKKTIADTLKIRYKSSIDKTLPIPEQFCVIKSRSDWEISWKTNSSVKPDECKFEILIFEGIKGGGFRRTVLANTTLSNFKISRKSTINPRKVLFSIVTVGTTGYQSPFSRLFRIRGRHIIFN